MKRNSIARNSVKLQEFDESEDESHIHEEINGSVKKTVITNKREHIYVENFETLCRKTTIETITRYILKEDEKSSNDEYIDDINEKRKKKDSVHAEYDTEEHMEVFELREIPKEKIGILRKRNTPVFILKDNEKYFFAFVPYNFKLTGSLKVEHRCAPRTSVCKRLSAKADCDGGCRKVRTKNKRLESFPWIKSGYETMHTEYEGFVVIECEHQDLEDEDSKYEKVSAEALMDLSLFLWNDVDTIDQLIKRINKNFNKR